ncbi:MaoC family dehydratase [Bacillus sp. FJAT-49705]|uniref:MaoC family dehydratase n=1 Tax=Cytobacillus citreus TaxID=2833586 RepID=A0ABS5NRE2_9BACI|nr:MaoC family dehydratase [Cytobacillus citreus]MBS4189484.1 MaoC family dehydratase [Cytobacillus citreus]
MTNLNKQKNGWADCRAEKPKQGAFSEFVKDIGLADIELFSALTGDRNPLHTDKKAAEASRFGGLIVQGGVTTGILNTIVAEKLPGPGSVFLSVNWDFKNPVYVGDTITGRVEILEVRDDKPICKIKTTVRNQNDVICLEGVAVTYTASLDGQK